MLEDNGCDDLAIQRGPVGTPWHKIAQFQLPRNLLGLHPVPAGGQQVHDGLFYFHTAKIVIFSANSIIFVAMKAFQKDYRPGYLRKGTEKETITMNKVICLGTREHSGWCCIGYDLQYGYGYETMLYVLDGLVKELEISIDKVWKAEMAGWEKESVWMDAYLMFPNPIEHIKKLKEECGEVSLAGYSKRHGSLPVMITMTNQTSILTFDVPEPLYSDSVKAILDDAARYALSLYVESNG